MCVQVLQLAPVAGGWYGRYARALTKAGAGDFHRRRARETGSEASKEKMRRVVGMEATHEAAVVAGRRRRVRIYLFLAATFLTVNLLPLTGCIRPSSVDSSSNAAIVVEYAGVFSGQTASGNLNLVLVMTVRNRGYESFILSPDAFSVEVNGYQYSVQDSDLPPGELVEGDQVSGRLLFRVPAIAASTRVGYKVNYSDAGAFNLEWVRQASPDVASDGPEILITYTGAYMWVPTESQLYLLLDLTIENRGYESFNTAPERFTLVMGEIFGETGSRPPISYDGEFSDERDEAFTDLRSYDLQDGGTLTGKIAYRVPKDILAMTESYRIDYSGVRAYNIHWKYVTPPEEQDQRRVRPQ